MSIHDLEVVCFQRQWEPGVAVQEGNTWHSFTQLSVSGVLTLVVRNATDLHMSFLALAHR